MCECVILCVIWWKGMMKGDSLLWGVWCMLPQCLVAGDRVTDQSRVCVCSTIPETQCVCNCACEGRV